MKVIINDCFGGFGINREAYDALRRKKEVDEEPFTDPYTGNTDVYDEFLRYNPTLISMVEKGIDCNASCAKLRVVDIPDEATDYMIKEYDGAESIIYVLDGKLHTIG